MNRGIVGIEGVVICAAIFGHVLILYLFCPSARLTDYSSSLNNKIVGAEHRVLHVCGNIIC
jgi:hypothetical protein